jgi:uncharacterized protein (TIGR02145 family)
MDILFIGTNTQGYGIDANGVRYLTLNMGSGGNTVIGGSTAMMKMALLNLGQSAGWSGGGYVSNNNAADLGDFYQWGRVADGHQNIVWSKDSDHKNKIEPMTGDENTSAAIDYNDSGTTPTYNSTTHQVEAGSKYYGKFINSDDYNANGNNDWYFSGGSHDNSLWGTANGIGRAAQGSLDFTWDKPENNPCPLGWRIPSMWNWWDIFEGDGLENDTVNYMYPTIGGNTVNNNWQIRDVSSNGTAYGGAIATNSANEKIFLPIIGVRMMNNGDLHFGKAEHIGNYWSSTYGKIFSAYDVAFFNGETNSVEIGQYARSLGYCVRCVAEPPK